MSDADLLRQARNGVEDAFAELYRRHGLAVYRYAFLLLHSVEDAEDATQETFFAALRDGLRFDSSRAAFRTWLIGIARNQAFKRIKAPADELDDDWVAPGSLQAEAERSEMADTVRNAVSALPPAQREAVFLIDLEEMSTSEAAEALNIAETAVKARLHRGRHNLKALLAGRVA